MSTTEKRTYVRSVWDGRVVLPTESDQDFESIWFALLEYKRSLEDNLQEIRNKTGGDPCPPLELEDQAMFYDLLSRITRLMNRYFERAREQGLS